MTTPPAKSSGRRPKRSDAQPDDRPHDERGDGERPDADADAGGIRTERSVGEPRGDRQHEAARP